MTPNQQIVTEQKFLNELHAIHPRLYVWAHAQIAEHKWSIQQVRTKLAELVDQSGR